MTAATQCSEELSAFTWHWQAVRRSNTAERKYSLFPWHHPGQPGTGGGSGGRRGGTAGGSRSTICYWLIVHAALLINLHFCEPEWRLHGHSRHQSLTLLGTAITEACLSFLKEQHFGKYPYWQLIHTNTQQAGLDKVYVQVWITSHKMPVKTQFVTLITFNSR